MLRPFDISLGSDVIFGVGSVKEVENLIRNCGANRAFVVTDPGVSNAGITGIVVDALTGARIKTEVFQGVSPNPSTEEVEDGGHAFRDFGRGDESTVVLAVGGGSAMDAAKALSIYAANPYSARELTSLPEGVELAGGTSLIAVPTTAGTAAETNGFGVITDTETHRKAYIGHDSVKPRYSILDPELTVGLPPSLTAATGVDAMSHALESLMSRSSNPYSEALALKAIGTIFRWLPDAVHDGDNIEARSHMLVASNIAGQAFATGTGLGLCHAIAHPLGAKLGMPHGVAISRLLPAVMDFNRKAVSDELALAAVALEPANGALPQEERSQAAVRGVADLIRKVLTPEIFSDTSVATEMVLEITGDALDDPVISNTPVMPTANEIEGILSSANLLKS